MKKSLHVLAFFVLLFVANFSIAQVLVGSTKTEIIKYYKDKGISPVPNEENLTFIGTDGKWIYFMDADEKCFLCGCDLNSQSDVNSLVSLFNTQYVIVSNVEWKAYLSNGKIVKIKLIYTDKGTYSVLCAAI